MPIAGELIILIRGDNRPLQASFAQSKQLANDAGKEISKNLDKTGGFGVFENNYKKFNAQIAKGNVGLRQSVAVSTDLSAQLTQIAGTSGLIQSSIGTIVAAGNTMLNQMLTAVSLVFNPWVVSLTVISGLIFAIFNKDLIARWTTGMKAAEERLESIKEKARDHKKAADERIVILRQEIMALDGIHRSMIGLQVAEERRLKITVDQVKALQDVSKASRDADLSMRQRIERMRAELTGDSGSIERSVALEQQNRRERIVALNQEYNELVRTRKEIIAIKNDENARDIDRRKATAELVRLNRMLLMLDEERQLILEQSKRTLEDLVDAESKKREQAHQQEMKRLEDERKKREQIAKEQLDSRLRLGVSTPGEALANLRNQALERRGQSITRDLMRAQIANLPRELQRFAREVLGAADDNITITSNDPLSFGLSRVATGPIDRSAMVRLRHLSSQVDSSALGNAIVNKEDEAQRLQKRILEEQKSQTKLLADIERKKTGLSV